MKESHRSHWLSLALIGALAACGGEGDPFGELEGDPFPDLASETDFGTGQSFAEEQAAQDTLSSALALDSVTDDSEQSLLTLTAVYSGATGMLGSALGDQGSFLVRQQQGLERVVERALSGNVFFAASEFPDCVVVDETETSQVVTFDCEETEEGLTATLGGTISLSTDGTTTTFSVQIQMTAQGSMDDVSLALDVAFVGDMSVSPEAVNGDLLFSEDVDVSYQGQSASLSYLGKVLYDVVLSGPGCAVDGDIKVAADLDIDSPDGSGSFGAVGQAVFGPGCNEVTAYARATNT